MVLFYCFDLDSIISLFCCLWLLHQIRVANIYSSRQTLSVFAGNAINVSLYCFDPDTLGKYPVVRFLENCYIAFFRGLHTQVCGGKKNVWFCIGELIALQADYICHPLPVQGWALALVMEQPH